MVFMRRAVCAAGLLAAAATAADVIEEQATATALDLDEECNVGDRACAFSALQIRGAALEAEIVEEAVAEEGGKPKKSKTADVSAAWEKKIYAWIVYIHKNITLMDWKMYYLKMDMNSTNNTIFDVDGIPGVNGTQVNWMKHDATWIPNFGGDEGTAPAPGGSAPPAPPKEDNKTAADADKAAAIASGKAAASASAGGKAAAAPEDDAALLQSEEDSEFGTPSRRRKDSLKGVPPRKKKLQTMMTAEQDRLNAMWKEITMAKRMLNWIGNYMGSHRRLYHGRPVLVQRAEAMAHERILESSRWSDGDFEDKPEPQSDLVEQIQSCINQTQELWEQIYQLGGMVQATKNRVKRYVKAKTPSLLQAKAQERVEVAWSIGGYNGFDRYHPESHEEEEAVATEGVESLMKIGADWSIFGTTEQCCRCKSGTVGWSASGKCNFCNGNIAAKKSVGGECTVAGSNFQGNTVCANGCKKVV